MHAPDEPQFEIDRTGVALIVIIAVVVAPVSMFASAWVLTDAFALGQASVFELVVSALACLLGLFVIRAAVNELRGGLGVLIDERGIVKGKLALAWDEIETLEAPAFGVLDVGGKPGTLRLRTYLYRDRIALLEHIARRTGKPVPEMGNSYY